MGDWVLQFYTFKFSGFYSFLHSEILQWKTTVKKWVLHFFSVRKWVLHFCFQSENGLYTFLSQKMGSTLFFSIRKWVLHFFPVRKWVLHFFFQSNRKNGFYTFFQSENEGSTILHESFCLNFEKTGVLQFYSVVLEFYSST